MWQSLLGSAGGSGGGGAGSGSGYSGELKNTLTNGGDLRATFGTVNFGAGSKVGGTSTSDGGGSNMLIYAALGVMALVLIIRR